MSKTYFIMNDRADSSKGYTQVSEDYIKGYIDGFTNGRPYFINLGYAVMETDEKNYRSFYKEYERNKYLEKLDKVNALVSYNALDSEDYDGAALISDISQQPEEKYIRKIETQQLINAISQLSAIERKIVMLLYYHNLPERDVASIIGLPKSTLHDKRYQIMKKISKYF